MTSKTLLDFADPHSADAPRLRHAFGPPRQVLVARHLGEVRAVLDAVEAAASQGAWCVGGVRYEAAPAFDAALQTHPGEGPLAWFAVHDAPLPWPDAVQAAAEPVLQWQKLPERSGFDAALVAIQTAIANGAYYQVNYTAALRATLSECDADTDGDTRAVALFAALQRAQPGGYAACIDMQGERVLSVSPELFFDWESASAGQPGRILARPMKGTAPRGATPEQDAANEERLRKAAKERAENVMVVDLLRNDLSRIAAPGSVRVPRLFHTEALPAVWQMTSDVAAQTRPEIRLWDVFAALFPCGSVTGAPKAAAMAAIRSLEPDARGLYCGALGVVRPGAQGGVRATFNVPIRTLVLGAGEVRCGVGSGITSGSEPEAEWQEWLHKAAFLRRASAPFQLLETFALVEGSFHHADRHLARMGSAAKHFGFPWSPHAARQELQIAALQHLHGSWRLRLLLAADGSVTAQAFPLQPTPEPVRLQLARGPLLAAHSEFVRFKTTRREHYESFAPQGTGVFDTVLYNEAGEITECTRGNIAMQLGGQWVTPPLACGLLPGIGRAVALEAGRVQEAVIRVDDIAGVQSWAFINSLRGWLQAVLVV